MTLFSILLAILMFGFMIFIHEAGHFIAAKVSNVKVNEFALGMGPIVLSRIKGETRYSLRLFPIGGFLAMEGDEEESTHERAYTRAPVLNRMLISVAGAAMNLLLGLVIMAVLTNMQSALRFTKVGAFPEDSVSAQYLEIGDEILKVNDKKVKTLNDMIYHFGRDRDGLVKLEINRNNVIHEMVVPFRLDPETKMVDMDFYVYSVKDLSLGDKAGYTFNWTKSVVMQVWGSLADFVTGRFSVKQLSGPIGVTTVVSEVVTEAAKSELPAYYTVQSVLLLIAFITVNLGVFNLLPLPALDGGRLIFQIIELVRRKPINPKYENWIHAAGFALLICLMLFVTFNDIIKFF